MGNRVCYKGMQVHGGVGYMREFNAERHYRDVRITNIYEGTSQLQVVAALGKMVGRGLDVLLDAWAAASGAATALPRARQARLLGTTELFKKCCDALHAAERDAVDYFGADLMDMAAAVVNAGCSCATPGSRTARPRSCAPTPPNTCLAPRAPERPYSRTTWPASPAGRAFSPGDVAERVLSWACRGRLEDDRRLHRPARHSAPSPPSVPLWFSCDFQFAPARAYRSCAARAVMSSG